MKSIATTEEEKNDFPKLMKGTNVVVLFTSRKIGTVVNEGNGISRGKYGIGTHHTDWNMDNFRDFDGEVTLSNN